jgi:hypothetical protein
LSDDYLFGSDRDMPLIKNALDGDYVRPPRIELVIIKAAVFRTNENEGNLG